MNDTVKDADPDERCACCKRAHRKLYLTKDGWVGKTCAEDLAIYRRFPNPDHIVWRGYESKWNKCRALAGPIA